jgi:hypothetical protein
MGAGLLESIPVFSIRPQAIHFEVPTQQFDLRSTCANSLMRNLFGEYRFLSKGSVPRIGVDEA